MPGFKGITLASTTARGYGTEHQRERRRLAPIVQAGHAYCAQPVCLIERRTGSRWIQPGTPWALGHNDTRTTWIGPVHTLCNQRDGARRGGQTSHHKRWTSRNW